MAAFPIANACISTKGFNETLPLTKNYLGGKTNTEYASATVTVYIDNDADMNTFTTWYLTNGHLVFQITLPFFGNNKEWDVRFNTPPKIKVNEKNIELRVITMNLTIIESL